LEASGLRGRGGAGFPTFQKVALVQRERARHKCVVVNAMEGEPASHKDQSLLALSPHLVLDGAESVARSIGASEIIVCVPRENQDTLGTIAW
jgi:NADH:ubiquinone oxidoreductase subunit F (NADH-binding)